MKAMRRMQIKTESFCVGDQISIKVNHFGKFTATVQEVQNDSICVFFDNIIGKHWMNAEDTTAGGYDKAYLREWLHDVITPNLSKKIQDRLISIELPSFGQIFGHDHPDYKYFQEDTHEQFPSMKDKVNRICINPDGYLTGWWLQNTHCPDGEHGAKKMSSAYFALVDLYGTAAYGHASSSLGVRPVLWLVVKP